MPAVFTILLLWTRDASRKTIPETPRMLQLYLVSDGLVQVCLSDDGNLVLISDGGLDRCLSEQRCM